MLVRRNSNWLPDVFNEFFNNDFLPRTSGATAPAINVIEHDNDYSVEIAAPGMTRDDFHVTLDEDENLVVDIEKKVENKEENKDENKGNENNGRYLRREFSYTKYHQTLLLPDDVDREAIAASVEHGVLTVKLPKKSAAQLKKESKVIEIS